MQKLNFLMHCVFNLQLNLEVWKFNELDGLFAFFQGEGEGSVVAEILSDGNAPQEGEGGGNAIANASE